MSLCLCVSVWECMSIFVCVLVSSLSCVLNFFFLLRWKVGNIFCMLPLLSRSTIKRTVVCVSLTHSAHLHTAAWPWSGHNNNGNGNGNGNCCSSASCLASLTASVLVFFSLCVCVGQCVPYVCKRYVGEFCCNLATCCQQRLLLLLLPVVASALRELFEICIFRSLQLKFFSGIDCTQHLRG